MDRTLNPAATAPTNRSAHAVGLAEWLSRRAARAPHRPALSCEDVHWNYGELVDRIECMSAVLATGGVGAGARVGYLGLNDPMFVVVLFATARLGAICVPLNFRLSGAELSFVINDAGVHTLVVGEEHIAVIDPVRNTLACSRYIHRGAVLRDLGLSRGCGQPSDSAQDRGGARGKTARVADRSRSPKSQEFAR